MQPYFLSRRQLLKQSLIGIGGMVLPTGLSKIVLAGDVNFGTSINNFLNSDEKIIEFLKRLDKKEGLNFTGISYRDLKEIKEFILENFGEQNTNNIVKIPFAIYSKKNEEKLKISCEIYQGNPEVSRGVSFLLSLEKMQLGYECVNFFTEDRTIAIEMKRLNEYKDLIKETYKKELNNPRIPCIIGNNKNKLKIFNHFEKEYIGETEKDFTRHLIYAFEKSQVPATEFFKI